LLHLLLLLQNLLADALLIWRNRLLKCGGIEGKRGPAAG